MNVSAARRRLEQLGPDNMTPGLERIRNLLEGLGNPHKRYPTSVVAGTNGKGSTTAMLGAIGLAAGLRVGVYSSPHLHDLDERFQIDGRPISQSSLEAHLVAVFAAVDELIDSGRMEQSPSYFEILTAVAFRYFAEARVDLAVLEVGLGGRLDATNVTRPRVAVITPIALDHTDWLGDDIAQIAEEKFAVAPPGGVAVVAPQPPAVAEVIERRAQEREITLLRATDFPVDVRDVDSRLRHTFDLEARMRSYGGLQLALAGSHQVENARCAVLAAEALDRRRLRINSDAIWAGLRRAWIAGRCEWFEGSPPILLDGAHNPDAAVALTGYLDRLRDASRFRRLHLVFGALDDKDIAGMAQLLYPRADTLITTRPPSPRSPRPEELLAAAPAPDTAVAIDDPADALARAHELADKEDLICVTGSIYLLGELRPLLLAASAANPRPDPPLV